MTEHKSFDSLHPEVMNIMKDNQKTVNELRDALNAAVDANDKELFYLLINTAVNCAAYYYQTILHVSKEESWPEHLKVFDNTARNLHEIMNRKPDETATH